MPTFTENEGPITVTTTVKDGLVTEKRTQDVEPVLERNTALRNGGGNGYSPSKDLQFVASIPNIVIEQWLKEGVNIFDPNCEADIMRRLNDGGYLKLRTGGGRL
jgi:hypothetical protein